MDYFGYFMAVAIFEINYHDFVYRQSIEQK